MRSRGRAAAQHLTTRLPPRSTRVRLLISADQASVSGSPRSPSTPAMNWTGGRLQRHSNSNTLTHRQKQHFAQVRTQSRNAHGNGSPPFRPQYLPPDETEGGAFESRSPIKRKAAFDQHETLAQLVQRLPSTKPQQATRPSPIHSHISPWTVHDLPTTPERPSLALHEGGSNSTPRVLVPPTNARKDSELLTRRAYEGQKCQRKKKRVLHGALKDDLVERERNRLLARHDWAGLLPSRPLKMHFPSTKERDGIGKRQRTCISGVRRVDKDGARQAPIQNGMREIFGGPWMSGALVNHGEDNIVVKIGPAALATQPPARCNDPHEVEAHLTPSDPMLFDLEDAVEELQPIPAQHLPIAGSHALRENLSDTEMGSEEVRTYAQAEPVVDVERLLQELDECSCPAPAAPASKEASLLASGYDYDANSGNDQQGRIRASDTHEEELMQRPTLLEKLESGGKSDSLDRPKTRVQTVGQPELQSSPPKPSRLLLKSSRNEPSAQEFHYHFARAPNRPQSRGSLELRSRPSLVEEGFHDIRRLEVRDRALDSTDQCPGARRTGSERQRPCRVIGEGGAPSTASADRAVSPCLSAELPISIATGRCANARSRWVKRSQPTDRSSNSAFSSERKAANTFRPSCSDALHSQASDSVPDIRRPGSPFGSRRQITAQAEKLPAAPTQGWIGDSVETQDEEAVWKRFVFGEGDRTAIDSAEEECESPEPVVRSALMPGRSITSSVLVEASSNSAAAGTRAISPACAHLHSVGFRTGDNDTAAAGAGGVVPSGEEQASNPMEFVGAENTTTVSSSTESRCLPAPIHDADAQANQASDDANTVAATAGESPGELAGLDRRERIIFTKPGAFVESMAAAKPAAAVEGSNALKGTLHTWPAGTSSKISNSRQR